MNQINEALASLQIHLQSDPESVMAPVVAAARAYVRGWITCPTCSGSGQVGPWTFDDPPQGNPCPDCVDGMTPSPELIERVADAIYRRTGLAWSVAVMAAESGLLASRREGETR